MSLDHADLKPAVAYAAVLAALALGAGPARAQAPAAAAPSLVSACVIGPHAGIPDADAETAAGMVCEEVRAQGQPIGPPVPEASGARYVVHLQKLGESVVVRLTRINAAEQIVSGRTLSLRTIEEVPVAAPRLARAVVRNEALVETRQMDNLVGHEARVHPKMDGETLVGVGVLTGVVTGSDTSGALVGADLSAGYELSDWGINANMRFGMATTSDSESDPYSSTDEAGMFALSVGGRYFLHPSAGTLFAGAGLGFDVLEVGEFEGVQPAVYAELGYELFRLTESRLAVTLRADVPLGGMERTGDDESYACDASGNCGWSGGDTQASSGDLLPVTLSVSYAF
jgi:hypothetical protein